jgi:hypothetical protein
VIFVLLDINEMEQIRRYTGEVKSRWNDVFVFLFIFLEIFTLNLSVVICQI